MRFILFISNVVFFQLFLIKFLQMIFIITKIIALWINIVLFHSPLYLTYIIHPNIFLIYIFSLFFIHLITVSLSLSHKYLILYLILVIQIRRRKWRIIIIRLLSELKFIEIYMFLSAQIFWFNRVFEYVELLNIA